MNMYLVAMLYLCLAVSAWYFLYRADICTKAKKGGNSSCLKTKSCGTCKGRRREVFQCFLEELSWYGPGGLRRRATYLKWMAHIRPNYLQGKILGRSGKEWTSQSLLSANGYIPCARDVYPSPFYFWGVRIGLYFFLGPIILPIVCLFGYIFLLCPRTSAKQRRFGMF